ncbi:hypothetical protein SAMN00017477_2139 [Peptoniphilus asaccharolyticus DSM 20463]|uniref:Uncharacterized protein n=1 Tax=Peptoniphilus asaccharolyticus DSM 20463 TaxID=573058 RepID=A0A1W1VKA3_PEPAS|nr:hypothetical protein SAMN00017477_2139 [Peptoniphilus asaccharolyticus DSM 20463]
MAREKIKNRDVLSLFNLINCIIIDFHCLDLSLIVREYVYIKKGELCMKQEILERIETEVNACKRYAENSVKKGKVGSAINFLDIAVTAKKMCR